MCLLLCNQGAAGSNPAAGTTAACGPAPPRPARARAGHRFATFAEFRPFSLREHARPLTPARCNMWRRLVMAVAVFAMAAGRYWWPLAMPVAGTFFAWLAHLTIEKNRPATFTYPLWSP